MSRHPKQSGQPQVFDQRSLPWTQLPLGELVEMVGGGTPSKQKAEYWDGQIPWVSPKDMSHRCLSETQDHITETAVKESATHVVPANSVLIVVRSGILVRRFPIAINQIPVSLNQDLKALVPRSVLLPSFVAYFLEANSSLVLSQYVKRGATVHSVDISKFKKLRISVPPKSEQRRIVEILDQADALRRLRAEADAKAERILPALFIKMFGDPATNSMGWELTKLGEVTTELRYGTSRRCENEPNGIPVLRIPNIIRGEVDFGNLKYVDMPPAEANRLALEKGDILFVRTNGNPSYVGRSAVFSDPGRFLFASYLIRARLRADSFSPWFVTSYLRTTAGRDAMRPFIRTTAGQSNISTAGLKQIPLPKPPRSLQEQFAERLIAILDTSSQHRQSGIVLDRLFQNLLHRAFSGDLTAKWRETHLKQLLAEMEEQARILGIERKEI